MRVLIEALNIRVMERKLTSAAATRANMRVALNEVADIIYDIEQQIFNSQGRRGGGSWKAASPEWELRKLRNGLDPRILHATLALRRSMSERGAPHQTLQVTSQSLRMGSTLPYAASQNRERPFVKFTKDDRTEMANVIKRSIVNAFRTG